VLARLERTLDAAINWSAIRPVRAVLLIAVLSLAVLLPGLVSMPVTDRDEARFVQASKQMVETGDLIDIRLQNQPRWKKPAGIYWLQAGAAATIGGGPDAPIWVYRLPSVLGAMLTALVTFWAARALLPARAAVLAGAMVATALLLVAEGHIAKTDAMLSATAAAALGGLAHLFFANGGRGAALVFWLAIAASILLKGPIVPAVAVFALAGLAMRRDLRSGFRRLRALWGVPLVIVLVAPWLVAIWIESDGAFFAESLGKDMGAKIAAGQEAHWGPPGLYLGLIWVTFWPWAALLPAALRDLWKDRRAGWLVFLAAWVVPFWLILELVPTKLPHYVLPLYPALAIAVAGWVMRTAGAIQPAWARWSAAVLVALPGGIIALGTVVLPLVIDAQQDALARRLGEVTVLGQDIEPGAAFLAGLALLFTGAAALAALRGRVMAQIAASLLAAAALYPSVLQYTLPGAHIAFPSPAMAQLLAQYRPCGTWPAYSVGYHEPSLVFLTETDIRLADPAGAIKALTSDPGAMVLMEDRWADILGASVPPTVERGAIAYFNPNRGKIAVVRLLTQDDPRWAACAEQ